MTPRTRRNLLLLGGLCAGAAVARAARPRPYSFRGKVVLVTGGSRGLGLVLARALVAEGARVAVCARSRDDLEAAATDLRRRGGRVLTVVCDVRREDQVADMVAQVRERLGPVDVLINNAGLIRMGPLDTMTGEDFRESLDTHALGPLNVIRAVLPDMRAARGGRIVNITSIGGRVSVPHLLPYCTSKHALVGLSRGLRAELGRENIAVTTICPGLMRTGSPPRARFKGRHRAEYAWFSISDSLPLITMSADRAARQILDACRRGRTQVTLTLPAKAAAVFDAVAPGVTGGAFSLVNRALPRPGGIGRRDAEGRHSHSRWSPSPLTRSTERAARRNNELPDGAWPRGA